MSDQQINIIDDILPPDLCQELIFKYKSLDRVDRTNKSMWDPGIVDYSTPILVNDLNNHERGRVMECINNYLPQIYDFRFNAMFYRWTPYSYIPPHNDGHLNQALTLHLNEDYNARDGGVFMYRLEGEDHWTGVEPRYNRLVHLEGLIQHWVTPVTAQHDRLSLQIFNIRG